MDIFKGNTTNSSFRSTFFGMKRTLHFMEEIGQLCRRDKDFKLTEQISNLVEFGVDVLKSSFAVKCFPMICIPAKLLTRLLICTTFPSFKIT